jgi:hypothetical protein
MKQYADGTHTPTTAATGACEIGGLGDGLTSFGLVSVVIWQSEFSSRFPSGFSRRNKYENYAGTLPEIVNRPADWKPL